MVRKGVDDYTCRCGRVLPEWMIHEGPDCGHWYDSRYGTRDLEGSGKAASVEEEVFAPLFSRPSSNKTLKVEVGGIEPPSPGDRSGLLRAQPVGRSRLEAPTGGGPLGQPGFDVRLRPPGGAVAVSLLTTPILPSQATGRGRLPSYLGSERVIVIGACVGPGF